MSPRLTGARAYWLSVSSRSSRSVLFYGTMAGELTTTKTGGGGGVAYGSGWSRRARDPTQKLKNQKPSLKNRHGNQEPENCTESDTREQRNQEPGTRYWNSESWNQKSETRNREPRTGNCKSGPGNQEPKNCTESDAREQRNQEPRTRNWKAEIGKQKAETRNPEPTTTKRKAGIGKLYRIRRQGTKEPISRNQKLQLRK